MLLRFEFLVVIVMLTTTLCRLYKISPLRTSIPTSKAFKLYRKNVFDRVTRRFCTDKIAKTVPQPSGSAREDSDRSWQTVKQENIVPVKMDKFTVRPELITFDAMETLIAPSQSVGRWYREVLNSACDMRIRLPRPEEFTKAFKEAYKEMTVAYPCFGVNSGMNSKEWWYQVISNTFKTTKNLGEISPKELDALLPEVCETLYDEVFNSKEGWLVKEEVIYTLTKLAEWRDIGNGPKLGIISNFDDRLENILTELDLMKYFDFVVTSYESKSEKPSPEIFNYALSKAKLQNPETAFHVGNSLKHDVDGAINAKWTGLHYNEWFDEDFPDWYAIESIADAEKGAESRRELMYFGRKDTKTGNQWVQLWGLDDILYMFGFPDEEGKSFKTTYIRGSLDD